MEDNFENTAKCDCHKLRDYPDKKVQYRETRKINKLFIFINFVLCIFLLCVTIFIFCFLQQLSANYDQALHRIKGMQTDMFLMKQKYKKIERRLKADKEMIYYDEDGNDDFPKYNIEEDTEEFATEIKQPNENLNSLEEILIRNKRNKERRRKKKCKNCLPAIQFEGIGGEHSSADKTDKRGLWTPSVWHNRYPLAKSAFHFLRIGTTGFVSVKKSGIYLIYAQVTLIGAQKRGYKILVKKSDGNISTLAVCKRHLKAEGTSKSDSCCTVKVVMLEQNDNLFVQEESDNTGANYARSHSYFGLIRLAVEVVSRFAVTDVLQQKHQKLP